MGHTYYCYSIVKEASNYTKLKFDEVSQKFFGKCPFCHDEVPTFSADDKKSYFFCYSCGAHGDRKDFKERIGKKKGPKPQLPKDEILLKIHERAAYIYYEQLLKKNNLGYSYFTSRGLQESEFAEYGLGYAPDSFAFLYKILIKDFRREDLMRSGLFKISKKGYPYDFFRNRVVFPIMDENEDVIAFGARVLDDSKPKYLNSPETEIFSKRKNLYGFPYNAENRRDTLLICEGYTDYIAIHNTGLFDCAAVLGTALTAEHAEMISAYYQRICLIFDSDGPGVYAAKRSIKALKEAGLKITVTDVRPAKDPDEFIRRQPSGTKGFVGRVNNAITSDYFLARHSDDMEEFIDILIQQV